MKVEDAPTLTQVREWHEQRRKEFSDAKKVYEQAEKDGKLTEAEVLTVQARHLDAIHELDIKIDAGLAARELLSAQEKGEEQEKRIAGLADTGGDPAAGGPGLSSAPSPEVERPDWYLDLMAGDLNSEAMQKYHASEEYQKFAQTVQDGPKGGYRVPTLQVQGLHRNYPMYKLEGLVRNIYLDDYADVHLRAITGFAMDRAPYLAPGKEAPVRDYSDDRRLLTPIRQTAQNIQDRPSARAPGFMAEIEMEMGVQFLRGTEYCIINGAHSEDSRAPHGVFTTGILGIPADRDVSGDNTGTVINADCWNEAKYHLKSEARNSPNLRWVMHRNTIARVLNLKGTDGHFIFREANRMGELDTVAGVGVVESEEAPNTYTANQRVAIIGDWRHYVLVHWLGGMVMAFDATQHYTTKGQQGTVFERYNDGGVMSSDCFARVTMGSA